MVFTYPVHQGSLASASSGYCCGRTAFIPLEQDIRPDNLTSWRVSFFRYFPGLLSLCFRESECYFFPFRAV
jgi:hypothetical protein